MTAWTWSRVAKLRRTDRVDVSGLTAARRRAVDALSCSRAGSATPKVRPSTCSRAAVDVKVS